MLWIGMTVIAYLVFNLAVYISLGTGGIIAMGGANITASAVTAVVFWQAIKASGKPRLEISLLGGIGIVLIVVGLRVSHARFPDLALSLEGVYNGFAVSSWFIFITLNHFLADEFPERPNDFDAICHLLMGLLVVGRFYQFGLQLIPAAVLWGVIPAILGYTLFNISIKLAHGHRATNVMMNVIGGFGLIVGGLVTGGGDGVSFVNHANAAGLLLGGCSIFGIVYCLGKAYSRFERASLVPPLVYDGILIGSPTLSCLVTGNPLSFWTVWTGVGMVLVTIVRYKYHIRH